MLPLINIVEISICDAFPNSLNTQNCKYSRDSNLDYYIIKISIAAFVPLYLVVCVSQPPPTTLVTGLVLLDSFSWDETTISSVSRLVNNRMISIVSTSLFCCGIR